MIKTVHTEAINHDPAKTILCTGSQLPGRANIGAWGGEFGRTIFSQGKLTHSDYGRDHHPRCFTMWMAEGSIRGGIVHDETDDFSYNIIQDPVRIRDLNATILIQLGIDHRLLTFPHNGLDHRLTGVEEAHVIKPIQA